MSHYTAYSPLFTGEMTDPNLGAKIEDHENFKHICDTVHDEWAFTPEIEWETPDTGEYPRSQFAYLYGYTTRGEELSRFDHHDSWDLNKCNPGSPLFANLWYATAMVCEPFSVLMYAGSPKFPRINTLLSTGIAPVIHRLDCRPGRINVVAVDLATHEEDVEDTYEWDADNYRDEQFLGGINY